MELIGCGDFMLGKIVLLEQHLPATVYVWCESTLFSDNRLTTPATIRI